jgi:hypothetical protein
MRSAVDSMSPLALGTLTLASLLVSFWQSGTLMMDESADYWIVPIQATGLVLTLSSATAFLLGASRYATRQMHVTLDQLVESGTLSTEWVSPLRGKVSSLSASQIILVSILGAVLGALNVPWVLIASDLGTPTMLPSISIAIGNLLVWFVVAQVFARRFLNANALRRLGQRHATIDLLRIDALLPFGRVGTLDLAIVAVTVSLTAFQSIDAELRWENYRNAFIFGIPAAITVLVLPMIGIRNSVRAAKFRALEQLDVAIAAADRDLEATSLHYLGGLLRRRESIEGAREWPLDTTAVSRVAIYVVIPPLAWVGGAFAEILIENAMGGGG